MEKKQKKMNKEINLKGKKGITLEWTQKNRQNWTWFNEGDIIKKVKEERKNHVKKSNKKEQQIHTTI